jgi:hypothetical protein
MFLLLYDQFCSSHASRFLSVCVFVSCFIMIPMLLYHVYNCGSAWFHLWTIEMFVSCTNLLYSNLFVHMRFFVTCSTTWYLRETMVCHFQCSGIVSTIKLVAAALLTVHTCSNYFNRWWLMDLLVEVFSQVCFVLLIYFSVNWQEWSYIVKCVVNTSFVFLTMENTCIKIHLVSIIMCDWQGVF